MDLRRNRFQALLQSLAGNREDVMPMPMSSKSWQLMSEPEKLDFLHAVCAELYRAVDSQTTLIQQISLRLANIEERLTA
jgi:hypothetical protein